LLLYASPQPIRRKAQRHEANVLYEPGAIQQASGAIRAPRNVQHKPGCRTNVNLRIDVGINQNGRVLMFWRDLARVVQNQLQRIARPPKPRHHRARSDSQDSYDVAVSQSFGVPQQNNLAQLM
jgi:hypothetical protein